MKGILRQLFGREIPTVYTWDDLVDSRANKLAKDYFVRITDIPRLYFELEQTGGEFDIDLEELVGTSEPPKEYKQLIASAVMNYELTQRDQFRIVVDKGTFGLFGDMEVGTRLVALITRIAPIETHQEVADIYVSAAQRIYQAYELATRK